MRARGSGSGSVNTVARQLDCCESREVGATGVVIEQRNASKRVQSVRKHRINVEVRSARIRKVLELFATASYEAGRGGWMVGSQRRGMRRERGRQRWDPKGIVL